MESPKVQENSAIGGTILVADDESLARKNICRVLEEEGYRVHEAADGRAALETIEKVDFDLVLTDLRMPELDGLSILKKVREISPQTLVVLMTAFASVDTAVEALRLGAQDYILKPVAFEEVLRKVQRLIEHKNLEWEIQMLRREISQGYGAMEIVGRSRPIQAISQLVEKVAPSDSTILITGESGVGKEVVARAIHAMSPRKDNVFLPVNCSAIPETLMESQLFGHLKGAFTGAVSSQEGLFQRARGGTIFLDEIGEMPLGLQPKLLRALETKEVLPVGSVQPVQVDVRIIASTNRDLKTEVQEGRFREDLYYRLNVIDIPVPPLRERREDIPLLVEHLIRRHNAGMKKSYKGVDNTAMKILMGLPWKGNIRELDNVLERAMILGDGQWITAKDLPYWDSAQEAPQPPPHHNLREALKAYEKSHIENVLRETEGDRTRTAQLLGLSRSSLYRKMEKLGIGL
ncbi:MAG TPA: sigma-54 dependent transcriptional regulator [Candidatus Acidoferrales bacterium]|nr:sigma-54 dependent transcriptional regulator [Candidatus Acidoferrales bacterium]